MNKDEQQPEKYGLKSTIAQVSKLFAESLLRNNVFIVKCIYMSYVKYYSHLPP